MSALHYGRVEAAADTTGRLVYTATAVEHALPGWTKPTTGATVTSLIPAQRKPTADDLQDLRDYTRIPTLSGFVAEVFGVNTKTFEEV